MKILTNGKANLNNIHPTLLFRGADESSINSQFSLLNNQNHVESSINRSSTRNPSDFRKMKFGSEAPFYRIHASPEISLTAVVFSKPKGKRSRFEHILHRAFFLFKKKKNNIS